MQKEMRTQEIVQDVSSDKDNDGDGGDEELDENKILAKLQRETAG